MIIPVLIDSRPAYLPPCDGRTSLLLTPWGHHTLLAHLRERLRASTGAAPVVLTTFAPHAEYDRCVRACARDASIVSADQVESLLTRFEPSDRLLLVDPRWLPVGWIDLEKVTADARSGPIATHLVALESAAGETHESVQLEAGGQIRRIQRYYHGVTDSRVQGVSASLVPVAIFQFVTSVRFQTLADLRAELARQGVASRDVALSEAMFNLVDETGLRALGEHSVLEATAGGVAASFTKLAPDIHVGRRCRIDPAARICGPVVIQDEVTIDANASIIGPALIGRAARIREKCVLAQCVVLRDTDVAAGSIVRHRVLGGQVVAEALSDRTAPITALFRRARPSSGVHNGSSGPRERATHPAVYARVKRATEATIAGLGLIILSPLLLLTAALVKLTSRGPALFAHDREGLDGKVFRCWKFRTMVDGAHRQQRDLYADSCVAGPQFKLDGDPRVTWLGHRLRISNIDELPQLINVLLGQMSLIGPRPSPFRENQICVPWREARLSVRPGITGLWQICRCQGSFCQWILYDMLYVQHMSFRLDLKILVATLLSFGGRCSVPLIWLIPVRKLQESVHADAIPVSEPQMSARESPLDSRSAAAALIR